MAQNALSSTRFLPWKVLQRRDVLVIPRRISVAVETVELPDGRIVDDYVQLHLTDFVLVFAETESEQILCLRQYRHGLRGTSLELIAGRIDGAETPLAAARRELLEESGYESEHWEALGSFVASPTQGIGTGYAFAARNAARRAAPQSGDLEDAVLELLDHDELRRALGRGEILAASHLATIALAMLKP